jgi:diacylglycerol kinase (ATP)
VIRRIAIAVNPHAGRGRYRTHVPRLVMELLRRGCEPVIYLSRSPEDLRGFIRDVVHTHRTVTSGGIHRSPSACESVIVVGGDGTWHQAVQELALTDFPACLLTTGTGDDNARSLGIPRDNPEAIASIAASSQTHAVDLGRIHSPDGTHRWFSGVLTAGFDSSVNARANTITHLNGTARYLAALIGELRTFRASRYLVTMDSQEFTQDAMIVTVGNGSFYGGGMKVCPNADPTDGLLDVVVVGKVSKARLVRSFASVYRGSHGRFPFVDMYRSTRVSISSTSPTVPAVFADGEYVTTLPVDIEIVPSALTLLTRVPSATP